MVQGHLVEGNLVGPGVLVEYSNTILYLKINKFKKYLRLEKKNSQQFKIICQDQHCPDNAFLRAGKYS